MTNQLHRKLMLLLAVVALLAGTFLLTPTAAVEASGTSCDWTFFSDEILTTIVGERTKSCQGQVHQWGIITEYKYGGCEPCG